MLAYATAQPGGAAIAWTAPPLPVDHYEVQRSHAGGAFTLVASVGAGGLAYADTNGQASDVYLVSGVVQGTIVFTSNPAPAIPMIGCWPIDFTYPAPWINWACIPCPISIDCLAAADFP
jgi:hypothetical protein